MFVWLFYLTDVEVLISTSLTDYPIFYTLDGSDPTTDSFIYENPIMIEQTSVLRAATVSSDCILNKITTQTYLIDEEINLPVVSLSTDPDNFWDNEIGIYVLGDNASNDMPFFGANFWEYLVINLI